MDSKLKSPLAKLAQTLFSLSPLESGRVSIPHADPRKIEDFTILNELIAHSLKSPNLIRTQTQAGVKLQNPKLETRPFQDEAILKRLLQQRDRLPRSSRIIRAKPLSETEETPSS